MVIVGMCVFPHGSMVLDPSMKSLPHGASELHFGCKEAANEIASWDPDVIILSTPHGLSLTKSLGWIIIYELSN